MHNLINNFGGNITCEARQICRPGNESEVLEILRQYSDRRIRAVGTRHSWNTQLCSGDVILYMDNLSSVSLHESPGEATVTVGAGCTLKALLDELHRTSSWTLPTLGVILKQTVAGAIATATHGSGRSSLSHYVRAIRIATYDPDSGEPFVLELDEGHPDTTLFWAGRCHLGYLGITVAVTFECVPKYFLSERLALLPSVEEVLKHSDDYALQAFALFPYAWTYYVFQRRTPRIDTLSWGQFLKAHAYRIYKLVVVDFALHAVVKLLARLSWTRITRYFFQRVLPRVVLNNMTITDRAEHVLTTRHDLYKHVEMEVFVPAQHLGAALELVRYITETFAVHGPQVEDLPEDIRTRLSRTPRALSELRCHEGDYTHHYAIFCRRISRDDTLISMTAGPLEAYYSLGFFTYHHEDRHFEDYFGYVARCLMHLHDARLHWGKFIPKACTAAVRHSYDSEILEQFRQLCYRYDPAGVFRNAFALDVLSFSREQTQR